MRGKEGVSEREAADKERGEDERERDKQRQIHTHTHTARQIVWGR